MRERERESESKNKMYLTLLGQIEMKNKKRESGERQAGGDET